jgi:Amt family ammonium transporter
MLAAFGYAGWTEQLGSIFIVGIFTIVMTVLIAKCISLFIPMRVSEEEEISGLDIASHGERAYDLVS